MKEHKEKAPFELTSCKVSLYMLWDKARNVYINPLPIDTVDNAKHLFAQLLETPGTYAYKGYKRFDLYRLGKYELANGKFHQANGKPTLIRTGLSCMPRELRKKDK